MGTNHTRWGWRKAHQLLLREGWRMNRKRTRRIWREEGLRRPPTCRKHRRVRLDCPERLSAAYPNHVWAIDFQLDETADQRRLKLLNIVDEFTLLWPSGLLAIRRSTVEYFLCFVSGTYSGYCWPIPPS